MPESESVRRNQVAQYVPQCPKCGARKLLEHIEPGHDLRTYECTNCGHYEVVKVLR